MKKPTKKSLKKELERNFEELKSLNPPRTDYHLYTLLRRLGLTKYEIHAYVALVERGPQTISQLTGGVSRTGIPQPRAYDVLGSLVQYGLVEESTIASGKEKRRSKIFRANSPSEGLNNLMNFFDYAKDKAIAQLNTMEQSKTYSSGGIWEIVNRGNLIRAAKRLIKNANYEILLVADVEVLEELIPTLKRVHKSKGILISTIIKSEKKDKGENILGWVGFMKLRYREAFSMPYLIVDREYALQWSSNVNSGQEIENLEVTHTLIDHFFFSNWKIGKPFPIDNMFHTDYQRRYPLSLVHIQTAIEEIEYIFLRQKLESGMALRPIADIAGFKTKEKEFFKSIKGEVIRTEADWKTGTFSIIIRQADKTISVGGMLASFEDITANVIEIYTDK